MLSADRPYLADFGDVAFENGRATAPCALHLQQCPIYDIYSDDNHKMASQVDLSSGAEESLEDSAASASSQESGAAKGSAVVLHEQLRWTHIEAGTSCTDYSCLGPQTRGAGHTAKTFHVVVAEIAYFLPKSFHHEITAVGTDDLIKGNKRLQDAGYEVWSIKVCPTRMGKPKKRERFFQVAG